MKSFYVTGGTLQRGAACYVERQADSVLYDGLVRGEFCYVLTSRQMGKSSLMVKTAARLREAGVSVIVLDLTAIGQNLNTEQWYNGLLNQMGTRLDLEDELDDFAYEHKQMGSLQRWMRAIREVVLARCQGRVVIFVDEIDAVRSLPFSTDEFFAGIREFYNGRSEDPELERLTFCLLGVATPSDLIRDTRTTPFNIGRRIELNDFTGAEAAPLARGLLCEESMARALLNRILYWTGGHPFLTQKMCRAVAEDPEIGSLSDIDALCEQLFFLPRARERDDNLLFVRERILRNEADKAGLLELYKRVRGGKYVRDDETDPLIAILRLSGIVKVEKGRLRTRNRIYERVFDGEWVKSNMPDAEKRRQRAAFLRGLLLATSVSLIVVAMVSGLAFVAVKQRNRAERQESDNRRLLYSAQTALAYQAWENGNFAQTRMLLENCLPKPDQEDLRGFEWHYLWRLSHNDHFSFQHTTKVHSVAFSPDGQILATGCADSSVELRNTKTGKELAILKGHTDAVGSVAFSPDGRMLATGSDDGTAKLWDTKTGKELTILKGHTGWVRSIAFSSDGRMLATGSNDNTAKLWDAATRKELATLKGHEKGVNSAAFSPDGLMLVTGSNDGTARLWDAATGKELAMLKGHTDAVNSAAFSPDGRVLATGSNDRTVKLWDTKTGKELAILKGHKGWVRSVVFSPDGLIVATGSDDRIVKLWDTKTGKELGALKGHEKNINSAAFSPDGLMLATGSDDGAAKLWNIAGARPNIILRGHTSAIGSLAFSPDGKTLATGSPDRTVKLWEVATGLEQATLTGHADTVNSVTFSPDSKMLATGSDDKTVRLWNTAARQNVAVLKGHAAMVNSVAFSPDGKILASASSDRTVKLWDISKREELRTLKGHTDSVYSVAFSPDGKRLATGSWDRTVKLWDAVTGQELSTLKGHSNKVRTVAFSPDGLVLVSVSWGNPDSEIKLWNVANGQEQSNDLSAVMRAIINGPFIAAFSPDGKRLVAGGGDYGLKLLDMTTKLELMTLKEYRMTISAAAFSPDGKTLATGSFDNTAMLWRGDVDEETSAEKPASINSNGILLSVLLNMDFEQGRPGQMPAGWILYKPSKEEGFTVKLTEDRPKQGRNCAVFGRDLEIASVLNREKSRLFGILTKSFDAGPYLGKHIRYRAAVRVEGPETEAQLWLRTDLDLKSKGTGFFANMDDRPIRAADWRYYDIVGNVGEDAEWITIGINLFGEGKAWIDDVSFEVLDNIPTTKSAKK